MGLARISRSGFRQVVLAAGLAGFVGCTGDPPPGKNPREAAGMPSTQVPNLPGTTPSTPPPAGTAGTTGTAGTRPPLPMGGAPADAGGAIDAGPGPVEPAMDAGPAPLPFCEEDDAGVAIGEAQGSCVAIGDLRVQYKAGDTAAADNAIKPHLDVINDGDSAINLSELTLRYWFTREGMQAQTFWCDYAQIDCAQVRGTFAAAEGEGADHYLEISFTGGMLAAGARTGEIQLRFNKNDYSLYDESDDYSYDMAQTSFADAPQVTLYRQGALAWGAEPPLF